MSKRYERHGPSSAIRSSYLAQISVEAIKRHTASMLGLDRTSFSHMFLSHRELAEFDPAGYVLRARAHSEKRHRASNSYTLGVSSTRGLIHANLQGEMPLVSDGQAIYREIGDLDRHYHRDTWLSERLGANGPEFMGMLAAAAIRGEAVLEKGVSRRLVHQGAYDFLHVAEVARQQQVPTVPAA